MPPPPPFPHSLAAALVRVPCQSCHKSASVYFIMLVFLYVLYLQPEAELNQIGNKFIAEFIRLLFFITKHKHQNWKCGKMWKQIPSFFFLVSSESSSSCFFFLISNLVSESYGFNLEAGSE